MRFFIMSTILFLVELGGWSLGAVAETLSVRHVEGESTVLRAGQTEWKKLQAGDSLNLGDRLVSSEGGLLQIESSHGVLELTDSTDLLIRSMASSQQEGPVTFELASGQVKGDWASSRANPLTVAVPGGEFQVENGFFSLWIYSLLGRAYTRVDLFRGEGFLQETSGGVPLAIMEGKHMTTGLQSNSGPRETAVIPGFDTFEIDPRAGDRSSKKPPEKMVNAVLTAAHT
jgi:hypothetical protein